MTRRPRAPRRHCPATRRTRLSAPRPEASPWGDPQIRSFFFQPSERQAHGRDAATKWSGGSAMRRSGSQAGTSDESRTDMRTAERARAWAAHGVARCGPGGRLRYVVPGSGELGLLEGRNLAHRAPRGCARRPVRQRGRLRAPWSCPRCPVQFVAVACQLRDLLVSPHRSPRNLSSTGATRPSPTRSRSSRDRDQLHAAWCGMAVEQSPRTYLTTPSARTRWARLPIPGRVCASAFSSHPSLDDAISANCPRSSLLVGSFTEATAALCTTTS